MAQQQMFSNKDWVVHRQYGIGQIQGTETKAISGEEDTYYRLEMANGTVWVPVDKMTEDLFRPVATEEEIDQVKRVLQRKPNKMDGNYKRRRKRIKTVEMGDSLLDLARLVRDLWCRHKNRTLSNTEQTALRRVTDRLVNEWAVCMDLEMEEAHRRLEDLLREARTRRQNAN